MYKTCLLCKLRNKKIRKKLYNKNKTFSVLLTWELSY